MGRQLRPRKSRLSYATLGENDTEDDQNKPGPSYTGVDDVEPNESDFVPDKDTRGEEETQKDEEDILEENEEDKSMEVLEKTAPKKSSRNANLRGKGKSAVSRTESAPRNSKRLSYSLPAPLVHHRHRAVPLFSRQGSVERLTERPRLFSSYSVCLTNSSTKAPTIMDRVTKSWGYNVGPGPLWDLIEDRGWFSEAELTGNDVDFEAKRRPRVYRDVFVREGWESLSATDAAPYLPTDVFSADGEQNRPPALQCYFGRINSQQRREVNIFDSFPIPAEYISESKAQIFHAGAPVWGMDWCPIHPDDRDKRSHKKYLAVAPFPSTSHSPDIGKKAERPSYACVQIWSFALAQNEQDASNTDEGRVDPDIGEMKCEMVLCLNSGPAYELKWCPLPSHDSKREERAIRKLGLLAGTFEDGSFSVFVVPDPDEVESRNFLPIFVRLPQPILRIELEETSCLSVDWADSNTVAIGTTNGTIAVYAIKSALQMAAASDHGPVTDLLPTHYLSVHQSAIRAVAWIRAPPSWPSGKSRFDQGPTMIASTGYDGVECITDIREGRGAIMNRTREVINATVYSPFTGGSITMDHENAVKVYSVSPSMLGRGHLLFEPQGSVWSVHASDYHPQLAVAAADGSCSTTNLLRSARRGGSVPFFVHKIYQMDYSRNTNEFRMLEQFLPQEKIDRQSAVRVAKAAEKQNADKVPTPPTSTGAWPQQVGIHRVVWNNGNGLGSSMLLASATASGLCRVDCLFGRWSKEKIPYGGVSAIRLENKSIIEDDEDENDFDGDGNEDAEGEDEDEEMQEVEEIDDE